VQRPSAVIAPARHVRRRRDDSAVLQAAVVQPAVDLEEVTIATSLPNKPAIISPVGDATYLYLLMPQRL
jgi:hypothetical protein